MTTEGDIPGYEYMNSAGLAALELHGVGATREGLNRLYLGSDSLLLASAAGQSGYGSAVEGLKEAAHMDSDLEAGNVWLHDLRYQMRVDAHQMAADGDPMNGVWAFRMLSNLAVTQARFPMMTIEGSKTAECAVDVYLRHQPRVVPIPAHELNHRNIARAARDRMDAAERGTGRRAVPSAAKPQVIFPKRNPRSPR